MNFQDTSRITARLCAAFLVAAALFPSAAAGQAAASSSAALPDKTVSLRSISGRFVVAGPDVRPCRILASWTEEVAGRFEDWTGSEIPYDKSPIRIGISAGQTNEPGLITVRESLAGQEISQHLQIDNIIRLDREDADEAICRLLLSRYIMARREGEPSSAKAVEEEQGVGSQASPESSLVAVRGQEAVPRWLSLGMAQNLYPYLRTRNSDQAVKLWRAGKLSLADVLESGNVAGKQPDKVVCGVFVAWLIYLPDSKERLDKLFLQLAEGRSISREWLVSCIPGCESIADVDAKWDYWIIRQKHIVYEPGVVTPWLIEQLKDELGVHPGDFGVPMTDDFGQRMEFRDLIDRRDARWIHDLCVGKSASLQTLAIGRGKEFDRVVQAYCCFLDALKRGKRKSALEDLLGQADESLRQLRRTVMKAD